VGTLIGADLGRTKLNFGFSQRLSRLLSHRIGTVEVGGDKASGIRFRASGFEGLQSEDAADMPLSLRLIMVAVSGLSRVPHP
jgi:hypothetical protein